MFLRSALVFTLVSATGAEQRRLTPDDSLPNLFAFTFIPDAFTPLAFAINGTNGTAKNLTGRTVKNCDATLTFGANDVVGDAAVVVVATGQGCWTSATYSHGNYRVEQGSVTGGGFSFTAYRVYPYAVAATAFAGSNQNLFLRLATVGAYKVYQLDGAGVLSEVVTGLQGGNSTNSYFRDTGIAVSGLTVPLVYVALPATQATPPTTRKNFIGTEATECMASGVGPAAVIGDVAVVSLKNGATCWTDGRYNSRDYLVERGTLAGSDGTNFTAYRVSPPATPRSQFISSGTGLYFRVATNMTLAVRTYTGQDFSDPVNSNAVGGQFTYTGVRIEGLTAPTIFVATTGAARVSIWPLASATVEAARLASGTNFSMAARRFSVGTGASPWSPEVHSNPGPGTHSGNYGAPKKFFPVDRVDGREGVVWQDQSTRSVFMTWFAADLLSAATTQIATAADYWLVGATSDGAQEIALVLVCSNTSSDKTQPTTAQAIKVSSSTGAELVRTDLPTDAAHLNLYGFTESGGSIAWNTASGTIGLSFTRTMTRSGDGLNHQGGIAVVFNASTMAVLRNHGQTSGHCFATSLLVGSDGSFLGTDLGDNYPRGISIHRFSPAASSMRGRLIYTFKTKHSTTSGIAGSTYPVYSEISTAGTTYYKWSNDNYVYTELGHPGIVEVADGLLVFFTGEQPPLNNSLVGSVLNVARNVAVVKVPKDLSSTEVLTPGAVETGGFYSFGGGWSPQTNKGISFLTGNTDALAGSASRLKTVRFSDQRVLLWWELWTATAYVRSQFAVADASGNVTRPVAELGYPAQLAFADDPRVVGSRAVAYAGTRLGQIARYELCVDDSCSTAPATAYVVPTTTTAATTAGAGVGATTAAPGAGATGAPGASTTSAAGTATATANAGNITTTTTRGAGVANSTVSAALGRMGASASIGLLVAGLLALAP